MHFLWRSMFTAQPSSKSFLGSWPLEMGPIGCTETSVRKVTTTCVIIQKSAVHTRLLVRERPPPPPRGKSRLPPPSSRTGLQSLNLLRGCAVEKTDYKIITVFRFRSNALILMTVIFCLNESKISALTMPINTQAYGRRNSTLSVPRI
jgi:hypothetical protein